MTTVPNIPTFDDFAFDILEHPSGNPICPLNTSLLEIEFSVLPGVTTHRLQSAMFTITDTSLAAGYLDTTALQYLRIVPYGDDSVALYGIIANVTQQYGGQEADGTTYNMLDIEVVGTETLLDSRECYRRPATTILPLENASIDPDDFAKYMVRETALSGTCDNDVDGNSRDRGWGTLVVEADAADCPSAIEISINEGLVGQAIQSLADKYNFTYELRPTFSGGAVTFTFKTAYPEGDDRSDGNTDGNADVILNDFIEAMIPEAEYHRTLIPMVNALHGSGYEEVEIDATSIAAWGRWEGASRSSTTANIQIELEHLLDREGCTFLFSSQGTGGAYKWLDDFFVGDTVTFANTRLGIAARDEVIASITASFPDGLLDLVVRWGDKTPTFTEDSKNENLAPSSGAIVAPGDAFGGYWQRIGTVLSPSTANDHVEAVRFRVDSAVDYLGLSGTNLIAHADVNLLLDGDRIYFQIAGVTRWQVSGGGNLYPEVTDTYSLGLANRRPSTVYGVAGDFTGDVNLGTGIGITHVDGNTDTYLLVADGTRYVPTDPTTLGIWGGYWQRAGTVLSPTTAGDYARADRFELGSATEFVGQGDGNDIELRAADDLMFSAGGAERWRINQGGNLFPIASDTYSLGTDALRPSYVYGVEGNFTGDVTIANGKGIIDTVTNTDGFVLRFNGTRGVPAALTLADIPAGAVLWTLTGDVLTTNPAASQVHLTDLLKVTGADIEVYA